MSPNRPTFLVAIDCLEEGLPNIKVRSFDKSVRARVVTTDADVSDMITFRQVVECAQECGAVVGDNLTKRAPPTQDIFVYPVADRFGSLCAEHTKLWVVG